jgi:2-hydroxychromene-2-carboxylate isomerase
MSFFAKPVPAFAEHALLCRMATLDFFYDLASTYSYLAAIRIGPLAQAAGVTVRWRPFLLGPIFKAQGYDTSPFNIYPTKGRNMVRDCERQCAELGVPFRLPARFPATSLLAGRVATFGLAEGWGEDFSRAVYRAEFAEGLDIGEPPVIAAIVSGLGHDAATVLARAQSPEIKNALRAATEDAERLGIFGAPSFIAAGELFWGNDRLEQALSWAKRA